MDNFLRAMLQEAEDDDGDWFRKTKTLWIKGHERLSWNDESCCDLNTKSNVVHINNNVNKAINNIDTINALYLYYNGIDIWQETLENELNSKSSEEDNESIVEGDMENDSEELIET